MKIYFLIALILPISSFGQTWIKNAKSQNISRISLCGDSQILNNQRSVMKHFYVGDKGYFFTEMLPYSDYIRILTEENLKAASEKLTKIFRKSLLWNVKSSGEVVSLGHPSEVNLKFKSTIKDCIEGAEKTIGGNCKRYPKSQRAGCCREKFIGPNIVWKNEGKNIELLYSPDPSVRLRVPGESKHRYCNVVERYRL